MNMQPVVVLGFTPSFLVMACQVWHVHALFLMGSFSQPMHLNWLSITFIYLVCLSLETGKKSRVTSSDQRIIYFFNQLGNKNQTNHDLTHSHFPCLVFPFGDAFVFPRFSPLSCFPALGASGLISHHFWRRLNEKHEDSHDSTCTFMNEQKYLWVLAFQFISNSCLTRVLIFRGCLSHNSPLRGRVRSIFSDEERSPRCRA